MKTKRTTKLEKMEKPEKSLTSDGPGNSVRFLVNFQSHCSFMIIPFGKLLAPKPKLTNPDLVFAEEDTCETEPARPHPCDELAFGPVAEQIADEACDILNGNFSVFAHVLFNTIYQIQSIIIWHLVTK